MTQRSLTLPTQGISLQFPVWMFIIRLRTSWAAVFVIKSWLPILKESSKMSKRKWIGIHGSGYSKYLADASKD